MLSIKGDKSVTFHYMYLKLSAIFIEWKNDKSIWQDGKLLDK